MYDNKDYSENYSLQMYSTYDTGKIHLKKGEVIFIDTGFPAEFTTIDVIEGDVTVQAYPDLHSTTNVKVFAHKSGYVQIEVHHFGLQKQERKREDKIKKIIKKINKLTTELDNLLDGVI